MDTKTCTTCKAEKPLTEFHNNRNTKDGLQYKCKACQKLANSKTSKAKTKSNVHEQAVIADAKAFGIPAMQATETTKISFTDVVMWGCVRVEVKYPVIQDGAYIYKFNKRQTEHQLACDVIALVFPTDNGNQYHFFSPLHPVFFRPDQKRKLSLAYIPNAKHRKNANGVTLIPEIMRSHENNWHMIETMRLDKMQQLKAEYRRTLEQPAPVAESAAA